MKLEMRKANEETKQFSAERDTQNSACLSCDYAIKRSQYVRSKTKQKHMLSSHCEDSELVVLPSRVDALSQAYTFKSRSIILRLYVYVH